MATTIQRTDVTFLELELTRRCPLACLHCYSESDSTSSHGMMTTPTWETVIGDAAVLGVQTVQLIGGEPTAYPDFACLLRQAIDAGAAGGGVH